MKCMQIVPNMGGRSTPSRAASSSLGGAAGFLSPQPYMKSAIEQMKNNFDVHTVEAKGWDDAEINRIEKYCSEKNITVVGGYAQKDAFHHIQINERLGNQVPSKLAFLYCMNKYNMRQLEAHPFWFDAIDPINETDEEIIAKIPDEEWPFMLKNTSLSLGRGIYKIKTEDDLKKALKAYREDTDLQKEIEDMMNIFKKDIDPKDLPEKLYPFIAEHMVDIEKSIEYCYEGYITPEGKIIHYALTEEVYFKNHQALGYLTPPMTVKPEMAAKLEAYVEEYMGEFVKLGYLNQFFNLEFWIMDDGETIHLTEINPRAAHSYHYNYLYSFGNNLYSDNLILAKGGNPGLDNPWKKWKAGDDYRYTLIILITGKKKGLVSDILDYEYVKHLEEEEKILIRHCRQKDDIITDEDMTAAGVMLQQIWITGDTTEQVIAKEHEVRKKLYKDEQEVDYPPHWIV